MREPTVDVVERENDFVSDSNFTETFIGNVNDRPKSDKKFLKGRDEYRRRNEKKGEVLDGSRFWKGCSSR
jgi:hypothetical protein